ncbi:proline-rich protein 23A3-like [Cricetulus griseus]|uniref:Proline-rich protein 23A3 n=1 Tax=Cricetulus griseus TaxID=10029 RepID=A0A9J7JTE1_CRIGR|nr:proline-rich protein 23A3-like [Cricetulus griseus]XP_027289661.1 proline-rich protein 23A3-like [Cricetulus griseus]XP_027289662.1 proline-rich protein 23A3 [Cricetulus griseus]XP_027289663.1 proline-rich protein 23A3-like [Cricetulus griseus]
MLGRRPRSLEDDLLQEELNPANRHRVQEPSEHPREDLPSIVVVPAGCAVKIHLEDFDLLLEPTPGSITQVLHPGLGSIIILVLQDLQVVAQPGQPVDGPCRPQEASPVDMAQEHLIVLQQGSASASDSHIESWENASCPARGSQESFRTPERQSPAVRVPEPSAPVTEKLSPMFERPVPPWPQSPSVPPSAERYAPWSIWSLRDSMMLPLPSTPLQPLPPSPPRSQQALTPQNHQKSPCTPCKTRKCLF